MQNEQKAIRTNKRQIRGESLISEKLPAGDPGKLYLIRAEAGPAGSAATHAASLLYLNIITRARAIRMIYRPRAV